MKYEIWAGLTSAHEIVYRFDAKSVEKAREEFSRYMKEDGLYYHYALRRTLAYVSRRSGDF